MNRNRIAMHYQWQIRRLNKKIDLMPDDNTLGIIFLKNARDGFIIKLLRLRGKNVCSQTL